MLFFAALTILGYVMAVKNTKVSGDAKKPARRQVSPIRTHHDEATATELSRNAFAREKFEFLLRTIFILTAVLLISIVGNIVFGMRETKIKYFAVDPEGGIREVIPLDRPIQTNTEVLNWTANAVTQAFTLDFANYQAQLNQYSLFFTTRGWASFNEALKKSNILELIIKQQISTSVVPAGAPVIVSQGISAEGGRYGWRVQIPIIVTYENVSQRSSETKNLDVFIIRRPETENPTGLGIAQIFAK